VAFPGESDRAFQNTVDLLEGLPIAGMHVFGYSPRPGTDAASFAGQLPRAVRAERSRTLRGVVAVKAQAFRRRFVGEVLEVAVLDRGDPEDLLEGLSDNYLRIWFGGDASLRGRLTRVRIEAVTGRGLTGTLVAPPEMVRVDSPSGSLVPSAAA
jgi:threonylcarbamoyladenosine tRNA methylthiotransferase MtaB